MFCISSIYLFLDSFPGRGCFDKDVPPGSNLHIIKGKELAVESEDPNYHAKVSPCIRLL